MALELGPDELIADNRKLKAAVGALDEQGWSTRGRLHPTTFVRAKVSLALITEEIVDIALSHSPDVTLRHLESVKSPRPLF